LNSRLEFCAVTGKLVRTLVNNQSVKPGFYNQQWNCTDSRDRGVAAGTYFYRLVASSEPRAAGSKQQTGVKTRKLVITR
jgi:hypothetical protein